MRTVAATPELVPSLLASLEPERVARMQAMSGGRLVETLHDNLRRSTITYAGLDDAGGVVTMGGVWPLEPPSSCANGIAVSQGYVWQLVTAAVRRHKRAYGQQTRAMLARALLIHERLLCVIEADHRAALRHVRRLGWRPYAETAVDGGRPAVILERWRP